MSFISNRIQGWRLIDLFLSQVTAGFAFGLGFLVYQEWMGQVPVVESYIMILGIVVLSLLLHAALYSRGRRSALGLAMAEDFWWVTGQTIAVAFGIFAFMVAFKDRAISRTFLFSYLGLLPVALTVTRKMGLKWFAPMVFDRRHQCTAVLLGRPSESAHLMGWLQSKACYGLKVIGWVTDEVQAGEAGPTVLGSTSELERVIARMRPGIVLATGLESLDRSIHTLREVCERYGARLAFNFGLPGDVACGITCYQDGGVSLIAFRNEPLESPFNRLIKRALDVAVSIPVVLFVLPPVTLVVWLIQRWQSPGPLLFRQERGGLRNSTFTMLKFRTMSVDNPDEALQASSADPRVYPAGRWLRRLSLDEFPQFVNVLLGHMSVVGPRPHYSAHDDQFAEISADYRVRSLIKPGITGLAQVKGFRGPTETHEDVRIRTRTDLYYLENWSLTLDLAIIARTAFQFLVWSKRAF